MGQRLCDLKLNKESNRLKMSLFILNTSVNQLEQDLQKSEQEHNNTLSRMQFAEKVRQENKVISFVYFTYSIRNAKWTKRPNA